MKKLTVLLLLLIAGLVIPSMVFGAGGKEEETEEIELDMWTWAANKEDVKNEIIAEYEAQNPNISITQRLLPARDPFEQALAAAQVGGESPDIYHSTPGSRVLRHVRNDQAVDLTPYFDDEWRNAFYESSLEMMTIDGKIYNVSTAANNLQVYFNKDLFEEYGFETPVETMDELVEILAEFKEDGYLGAYFPGNNPNLCAAAFITQARLKYPDLFEAADTGDGSWDIPEFLEIVKRWEELGEGLFFDGFVGMDYRDAQIRFMEGDTFPAFFSMSAAKNTFDQIADGNPAFELDIMLVPSFMDGMEPNAWGSLGGTWLVSSQSPNKEAAIDFLRYATTKCQDKLVKQIGLCPAGPPGEVALEEFEPDSVEVKFAEGQSISVWRDMLHVEAYGALGKAMQAMFNGDISAEEVLPQVQKAKEEAE